MLPRVDAGTVTPVTPGSGGGASIPLADGRQAAFQRAVQNLVGQTVNAEVLSKLQDGSYLVKVADNAVRMMLPGETQVGGNVSLTVLSAQPRPTFQLANTTPGSTPTLLYSDGGASDGGEAASLPSQGSAVFVPSQGKPATGGASGTPGQPATSAGDGAEAAPADGEALPGQVKAGAQPATSNTTPASGRPALPAGAAELPDAAVAGRPGAGAGATTASGAGTPATSATTANATPLPAGTLANAAGAGQAQAAATALGAGNAAPADGVKPQSLAASLLGKAPLTPAHELPELGPNAPQATLSSAARVLTSVLSAAQGSQAAQVALIGKSALFGNSEPDTAALAQKLHDTISQSGLFYESHVAEWAKGERPLSELAREPQMQRLLQQQGNESAARAATGNGPDLGAAQMINQQLHTQEQQRVLWNGQAWPGQQMEWEVRRDQREGRDGGRGDSDGEPEQIWRSGVRFRLPTLGAVSAAVTLIGDQVHIQVQTDSDASASTLRAWSGKLESAMEAAGAQLTSLNISQETGP